MSADWSPALSVTAAAGPWAAVPSGGWRSPWLSPGSGDEVAPEGVGGCGSRRLVCWLPPQDYHAKHRRPPGPPGGRQAGKRGPPASEMGPWDGGV